ncbi:unnamed protein product [Caretta caretta]
MKDISGTSKSSSCTPASYERSTKNLPEMSEQAVTYADLKFQTPSKQQRKKTPKNTRNKEGNEEVVTYTGLKCNNASEQERRERTMNSQSKDSSASAPAWGLVAGILGIFCLALVITVGVLAANVFQISQIPCRQQENLNQFQEIIPEDGSLLFAQQIGFPMERNVTTFLLNTNHELNFINPLATSHWIGLLRDKTDRPWMWGNGTAISTDQFAVKKGYVDGDCAVVRGRELFSDDCKDTKRYICELPVHVPESDVSGQDRS